jgi:hypothetical protein
MIRSLTVLSLARLTMGISSVSPLEISQRIDDRIDIALRIKVRTLSNSETESESTVPSCLLPLP